MEFRKTSCFLRPPGRLRLFTARITIGCLLLAGWAGISPTCSPGPGGGPPGPLKPSTPAQQKEAVFPLVVDLESSETVLNLSHLPWEFYWDRFVPPEAFAENAAAPEPDLHLQRLRPWHRLQIDGAELNHLGHATYRITLHVKNETQFGLYVPAPFSSYVLYVNGHKHMQAGIPKSGRGDAPTAPGALESGLPEFQRLPTAVYFQAPEGKIDLVFHVANYLHSKAGMRANVILAEAGRMRLLNQRSWGLDLFGLGLIGAIMIYHLCLVVMRRQRQSYLIFTLLALDYFLLALFFGQQSISTFFPELSFEAHSRLGAFFMYLFPIFLISFTHSLYGDLIRPELILYFRITAIVFLSLLFFPVDMFTLANQVHHIFCGVFSIFISFVTFCRAALRRRPGALLLVVGSGCLVLFSIHAVYLFQNDFIAGSSVTAGFAFFALFQAAALAQEHATLVERNQEMTRRVLKGREALARHRRELDANLHDNLGGNLTDLKLAVENLESGKLPPQAGRAVSAMAKLIDKTIGALRNQLLFMDDLELVMNNFLHGIQLILLRRYHSSGRELDFQVEDGLEELLEQQFKVGNFSDEVKLDLTLALQEICTNSLKYGKGNHFWRVSAQEGNLIIHSTNARKKRAISKGGKGTKNLGMRLKRIGGQMKEVITDEEYNITIFLPMFTPNKSKTKNVVDTDSF